MDCAEEYIYRMPLEKCLFCDRNRGDDGLILHFGDTIPPLFSFLRHERLSRTLVDGLPQCEMCFISYCALKTLKLPEISLLRVSPAEIYEVPYFNNIA